MLGHTAAARALLDRFLHHAEIMGAGASAKTDRRLDGVGDIRL